MIVRTQDVRGLDTVSTKEARAMVALGHSPDLALKAESSYRSGIAGIHCISLIA